MRRTLTVFTLAALAAALSASGALAKEGGIELSTTPAGKSAGEPWVASMVLIDGTPEMVAKAKPGIQITSLDSGRTLEFPAKAMAKDGVYSVRVVFPEAGTWVYATYDGVTGRMYEFPPVEITAPPAAAVKTPRGTDTGAFPVWTLVGALSALALASAGAILFVRRRQPRLSH